MAISTLIGFLLSFQTAFAASAPASAASATKPSEPAKVAACVPNATPPKCTTTGSDIVKGMHISDAIKGDRMDTGPNDTMIVSSTKSCGFYESMGFQKCDTVVTVDGAKFNTSQSTTQLYDALKKGREIPAEVIRQGKPTKITLK